MTVTHKTQKKDKDASLCVGLLQLARGMHPLPDMSL